MTDILIIGGGTAGMTAALYALRNNKTVKLLEPEGIGGQIATSPRVENFPTIESLSGAELSDRLFEQIEKMGAELEMERAEEIVKHDDGTFTVRTDYGSHDARSVIIAAGVKHKTVGLANEEELVGNGVSYCAVCDGAFYSGEEVVLVGDANTALQYAILLSGYCKKVYVCTWMDRFFGDKAHVDVLLARENVEWVKNVNLIEFEADDELTACIFEDRANGGTVRIPCKACFVAIGQVPDLGAFANVATLDKAGYIVAGEDCRTDTEGVYVAGDCRTKTVRQLTTAVADGAVAALAACAYVDKLQA